MFIAPRDAKCSRPRCSFAGHDVFSHRQTASSSGRCSVLPQRGQMVGMTHGFESAGRLPRIGPMTRGMTSPAFSTMTQSPSRMSLRAMSSALCSVAIDTVEPDTKTGSSIANGVTAPVRPTFTSMLLRSVVFCSAGNLNAIAHLGNLLVVPRRARRSMRSSLITTPSVSKSSARRFSSHSRQNSTSASTPWQRCQCGSTGSPHALSASSVSPCVGRRT